MTIDIYENTSLQHRLRNKIYEQWREWIHEGKITDITDEGLNLSRHLWRLVKAKEPFHGTMTKMTPEEVRKCQMLAGPNGYAVYRAMLLKKGEEQ